MANPEDASVHRPTAADLASARSLGSTPTASDPTIEADPAAAVSVQDQLARSIIRSKVQPPPVRSSTLERPRLLQWLGSHTAERLILINAEAGYGKTTLLADFARRSTVRCLWYRLDATDREWVTFINYVIAAVREVEPDFGAATAGLLAQMAVANVPLDVVLDSLISELPTIGQAPTLLMLDDFHLVDDATDVHQILSRLFERAPQTLSFVLASRAAPNIRTGRLAAHGQVARLDTDDLRFSGEETADLFALAYQLPLEPDLVEEIDARAEGWAASLQLVYSSIRQRRPSEARAFIQSLSGAEGALYDYLAEEVLAGLAPPLQRVLVRASLLERVVPSYVMAILLAEPDPPTPQHLTALLDEADSLGLMGRRAAGAAARRFHPLLRDYLRRQLDRAMDADSLVDMHKRVAEAAEQQSDWLMACHHFIEGHMPVEAMRVLGEWATAAVGAGAMGAAMSLVTRAGLAELPPAVRVIEARHLMSIGAVDRAAEVLGDLGPTPSEPNERALAALAQVHAAFRTNNTDQMERHLAVLIGDENLPTALVDIGRAWRLMLEACRGGEIRSASRFLAELADRQSADASQPYFAGISYHNAALYELARGNYLEALRLADRALERFSNVNEATSEALSSRALATTASFELGYIARAEEETRHLLASEGGEPDAYADAAWTAAMTGDAERAAEFLRKAHQATQRVTTDVGMQALLSRYEAMLAVVDGRSTSTEGIADDPAGFVLEPDFLARNWFVKAVIGFLSDERDQGPFVSQSLRFATTQGADRIATRLAVVHASLRQSPGELTATINRASQSGSLALLEVADVVCGSLHMLHQIPPALLESIKSWPHRWLPALRREMGKGNAPSAHVAARLLSEFGALSDVPRLVAFERTYIRTVRQRDLSRPLILRASPPLHIHDLGRSVIEVGASRVDIAKSRRKAATLLMLLVTRPNATATREHVIEELWPDLEPGAAANSLNQTLYFLRRDIDPWYDDVTSADYIVNESELIWLDPRLVTSDSIKFVDAASSLLRGSFSSGSGLALLRSYRGRFAPEFEYEEWAISWRERVHSVFLLIVHETERALADAGDNGLAVEMLLQALAIDPDALEVEATLVRALRRLGAEAAASEQYAHYARTYRSDLGAEPPTFDSLRP